MKKQSERTVLRICFWAGIGLLVAAAILLGLWQLQIHTAKQKADDYVTTIRTLTPTPQSTVLEERRENRMPVLSVDGINFAGILEMPKYGSALPVCADWGSLTNYPCCLSGSVYDRTIQIGSTSQKGFYDFYREICVGDTVFYTDMEGNRFSYTVTDIRHAQHADQSTLRQTDADLTLFIQNIYAFEYILIFCSETS